MSDLDGSGTDMQIPLMRPTIGDAEIDAVTSVLRSGWIAQGPQVMAFEQEFARTVGAAHAVAVSSCTTGLHLALLLAAIGPGDEVIVPSLSFIASTNAVAYTGATPVYADVDAVTGNMTQDTIAAVMTERTSAVMVVHQAGVPADLAPIETLCRRRGLALIEDAACAIGSTYDGEMIGGRGSTAVFSFHPRKIVTTGEGGMMVVADETTARHARQLREHGMNVSAAERHRRDALNGQGGVTLEGYGEIGFNYRMTDIQAAMGLVQLQRLPAIIQRRRELAEHYRHGLADVAGVRCVTDPPYGTTNFQSMWAMLPGTVDRTDVMAFMASQGVSTRRGIMAAHLEPAGERWLDGALPVTEALTRQSIILPLFHEMSEHDVDRVCTALRRSLS